MSASATFIADGTGASTATVRYYITGMTTSYTLGYWLYNGGTLVTSSAGFAAGIAPSGGIKNSSVPLTGLSSGITYTFYLRYIPATTGTVTTSSTLLGSALSFTFTGQTYRAPSGAILTITSTMQPYITYTVSYTDAGNGVSSVYTFQGTSSPPDSIGLTDIKAGGSAYMYATSGYTLYYYQLRYAFSNAPTVYYDLTTVSTFRTNIGITPGAVTNTTTAISYDGAIAMPTIIGGVYPILYSWTDSTVTTGYRVGLLPGTYTLNISDSDSTPSTATTTYILVVRATIYPGLVLNTSTFAATDGKLETTIVTGPGPFTYAWSDGAVTTPYRTALATGTYTLTVSDTVGVVGTQTFTVYTDIPTYTLTHPTTVGGSNGSIVITIPTGTASYSISWSDGVTATQASTAYTRSTMYAGAYILTITDGAGKVCRRAFTLREPVAIVPSAHEITGTDYTLWQPDPNGNSEAYPYLIAISGTTMAASCYTTDGPGYTLANVGCVYMYEKAANGRWALKQKVLNPDLIANSYFGLNALAIDEDILVVGDYGYSSFTGRVYTFTRTNGIWSEVAGARLTGPLTASRLGASAALSKGRLILGQDETGLSYPYTGQTYVYTWSGTTWTNQITLTAYTAAGNTGTFIAANGSKVGISGDYAFQHVQGYRTGVQGGNNDRALALCAYSAGTWTSTLITSTTYLLTVISGANSICTDGAYPTVVFLYQNAAATVLLVNVYQYASGSWVARATITPTGTTPVALLVTGAAICIQNSSTYMYPALTATTWATTATQTIATTTKPVVLDASGNLFVTTSGLTVNGLTSAKAIKAYTAALRMTAAVVHPTTSGGTQGTITITVSGGTLPYTISWSDGSSTSTSRTGLGLGTYIVTVVDKLGNILTDTYTLKNPFGSQVRLTSGSPTSNFYFGEASCANGNWAMVGEYGYSANTGCVWVFQLIDGTWTRQTTPLTATPSVASSKFGYSVCVRGTRAIIGSRSGGWYMFNLSGTTWSQMGSMLTETGVTTTGQSVSICGDYAIVGVSPQNASAGAVYIYYYGGTTWALQSTLTFIDASITGGDQKGYSVSIYGDYAIVGAPKEDLEAATTGDCGAVYFFKRSGTTWTQIQKMYPASFQTTMTASNNMGMKVGMGANYAVAGSYTYAYIYYLTPAGIWELQVQKAFTPAMSCLVAISDNGKYAAFGDYLNTTSQYIYMACREGTLWSSNGYVVSSDIATGNYFGGYLSSYNNSMSITDNGYILIGDPASSSPYTGAAYIFNSLSVVTITPGAIGNVSVDGATDGTIASPVALQGTSPYTYAWSDGSVTTSNRTGLAAGTYVLTVTDSLSATGTYSYVVATRPSVTITPGAVTSATSYNGATGAIATTTVSGGGIYTCTWSDGSSTAFSRTALVPGTYTITVNEDQGNSATYVYTVSYTITLSVAGTVVNVTSSGATDGTISAPTVTGALAPLAYSWSDGSVTTSTRSGLAAGSYTNTITDANGIYITRLYTMGTKPAVTLSLGTVTNTTAWNATTGAISATTVSGGGSYTYNWSDNVSIHTTSRSSLIPGDYTLTVVEAQGNSASYTFTVFYLFVITAGTVTNISATGLSDGSIAAASYTGYKTSLAYTWDDDVMITTASRSAIPIGSYTLHATDANGIVVSYTYTVGTKPAVSLSPGTVTHVTAFGATNGAISTTTVSGGGSYIASWSDGSSTAFSRSGLAAGDYTLTVTEAQGNTASYTFSITSPLTINAGAITNVSASGQSDGSIAAPSITGGYTPYIYSWGDSMVTTSNRTSLAQGSYILNVTDNVSTTSSYTYTIGVKPEVILTVGSITRATGYNVANGSISVTTVSGGGSYAFSWSDGSSTATSRSALVPATYTLTVTEAQGNSAQYAFVVSYTISATAGTVVNVTTSGATDGTTAAPIVTGAFAPLSYIWNDGSITTATRTGLAVGNYTVTVTDTNGISTSVGYTIGIKPSVTLTPGSVTNCTVYTSSNGSIATTSVAGGGSYTYSWSDNGSIFTSSRSSLAVGYYTLTVTEAQGNTASHQFTVTSPITLTAGTITNITTTGQTNGSIGLATVSGGMTPYTYTYSWGDSAVNTSNRTGLAVGDYTLTVTDPIGATSTHTYTIGTKPQVILTIGSVTNATGYNVANGAISITSVSGGGSYVYSWSDGSSTATSRSSLVPGNYTLTVTETQGNSASTTFTVSYTYSFTSGSVVNISSTGQYDGSISGPTAYNGGKPGFSYVWS
jgi:hypothetical protein